MKSFLKKFSNHKMLAGLLLALAVMLMFRLLAPSGPSGGSMGMMRRSGPVYVELGQARFGTMREVGLYYGSLAAARQFSVSPRVDGRLDSLSADLGDHIKSGQVLARLDDEPFRLARNLEAYNVGLAEAQFDEAQANFKLAQSDLERQSSLAGKRIVSQSDFEVVENKLRQTEARLEVAESLLRGARSRLAKAELELSCATISSSWPEGGADKTGEARP